MRHHTRARSARRQSQTPADNEARTEARRLAELLDVAQDFGRVGVWERDVATGKGRWDPRVFEFFGLDPAKGTPSFQDGVQRIHPDDRSLVKYHESLDQAGNYSQRFRIVRPDGSLRVVQSLWRVLNSAAGVPARVVGVMVDDTEVYELARALNETSSQLELAVNLGNIAIWRQDLVTGRFHSVAKAFELLGREPRSEGLSNEELRALVHPDDLAQIDATNPAAFDSAQPVDQEIRYRHADGTWRCLLTRRVVRRNAKGVATELVGVALDVTQRVEKSRHAAELAKRLEVATSAAELGVWSRDSHSLSGEWNAQMFRLFDRDPRLGVPTREEWLLLMHPDDRPFMSLAKDQLMQSSDAAMEHEFRVIRKNGELRWIAQRARREVIDGRTLLLGVSMDVTARVRAEAALRTVNERVALAARSIGLGTWEWNIVTGAATWDDAMFTLRGLAVRATAPTEAQRLAMAHPDDRARVAHGLRDAVLSRLPVANEFRVVWPDGTVRWLATRATPIREADGRVLRYIGVDWDVTERVNAEAARQEGLIAQRESAAKSEFLARMSHELRTPLNAVLGFAQLLQRDQDRGLPVQRAHIDHIRIAGDHLLALIDDVLDLSSLQSGQLKLDLQSLLVADVVAEVLPMVEPLARLHGIAVHTGSVAGSVRADRTRLRQVLINLLTNAIKYNRAQGEVRVDTRLADDGLTLRVSDTGRGLTPEQIGQLFEPFNRLGLERESIEGTGIGLAIVKALVDGMQGSIRVTSQAAQGTVFEVTLPGASTHPRTDAPHSTDAFSSGTGGSRWQILYIEDNPVNVLLVEELVASRSDLAIVSVGTGAEGVSRARMLRPDLVLVDMQLPDFDGFEVLRRIRSHAETASLNCIALSANAIAEDIALALQAGFSDYWTKPINLRGFLASLEAIFPTRSPDAGT